MSHSDEQRQSKWFYRFYSSFMVDKYSILFLFQNDGVWNPWLWAPLEMTTGCYEAIFFVFLQIPGGDTIDCQIPGPPRLVVHQMPGGMLAAGIDSNITSN